MLNAETGNRLKQQYVDAETGDVVERDERVKGYEIAKGDYVFVTDEELNEIEIESSHTIDIQSFAARSDVDPVYFDNSYYIAPDDKVGAEAFAVIREAMRVRDVVGIGRVVLYGRERIVMLEPRGEGILATSLRCAYEVRDDKAYFEDIPRIEISKEMLDLALHIIDVKAAKFDPATFKDAYQEAVVDLIRAKRAGRPAPAPRTAAPSNVVSLMDALRRSLGPDGGKGAKTGAKASAKPPAAKAKAAAPAPCKAKAPMTKARVRKAG
jgi:DNA end-binding protein Ku